MAAAATATVIAGPALALSDLSDDGRTAPVDQPSLNVESTTPSPEPPGAQEEASPGERYQTLRTTLTSAPGWAITDAATVDPTVLQRYQGNWMEGAGGRGAGHNLGLSVVPGEPTVALAQEIEGFTSPTQASKAADRLIANLTSCPAESWRSQPIGKSGAALAFTDAGVLWIHHKAGHVATLHVATNDGPPPKAIQVEVADLIYSWFG